MADILPFYCSIQISSGNLVLGSENQKNILPWTRLVGLFE